MFEIIASCIRNDVDPVAAHVSVIVGRRAFHNRVAELWAGDAIAPVDGVLISGRCR